ncbi:MAG: biotin/lipoyl-binding protein [Chlorobi bacterium CHB2]|nr:biotin/lipoyl-binding protein [Chlorobi bacterium CHB2]
MIHFVLPKMFLYVWPTMKRTRSYTAEIQGAKLPVSVAEQGATVGEPPVQLQIEQGESLRSIKARLADGTTVPVYVEEGDEEHEFIVYLRGNTIRVRTASAHDERLAALRKSASVGRSLGQLVTAPMPGLLKQILVAEGEVVQKGQSLCILEAMKMENEIKAPERMQVQRLLAQAGSAVEKGAKLMELKAVAEG